MDSNYTMLPTTVTNGPLSVDDFAIGEILIALKRDPVVHPMPAPPPAAMLYPSLSTHTSGSYRTKVDLSVTMPPPNDTVTFDGVQYDTVSPVASALYTLPPTATAQSPSERTKRYGPVIQLEDLRKCFNMPIAGVARQFGICATLLKKICRRHGIQRWPHRQIRSLQKSIDMLRESLAVAKGSNKEYIAKKIAAFEYTLECIMQDPNTAAKGISTGRLASPASEDMAKRAKRAKEVKKFQSSVSLSSSLTEDDEEDHEMSDNGDGHMVAHSAWTPFASTVTGAATKPAVPMEERKDSMSLASILC